MHSVPRFNKESSFSSNYFLGSCQGMIRFTRENMRKVLYFVHVFILLGLVLLT
ncbi:hypothetical protein Lalb_Chr05g0225001 [Lupinus albus]|uniref:Uncharacterized protein n=1 Tax=Lupinus albus TaxID=3870 RepID=A0A6A4QJ13_LUPAL|nr:hypothetical protein Lalb_Chr05g0225001 [Lupinus albus]